MIREIITDVEKLSVRSDECDVRKKSNVIRQIIIDLKDTMKEKGLLNLAGIQIEAPTRVLVMNIQDNYKALCQPYISDVSGFTLSRETDPSIPDKTFIVPRYNKVTVHYLNPLGKPESKTLLGLAAYLLQQSVDHLEGILISDFGLEIDDDFDQAIEEEKEAIIKCYLDSIDVRTKDLEKAVEEDPEAKKVNDAIAFMRAKQEGKVMTEPYTVKVEEGEEDK